MCSSTQTAGLAPLPDPCQPGQGGLSGGCSLCDQHTVRTDCSRMYPNHHFLFLRNGFPVPALRIPTPNPLALLQGGSPGLGLGMGLKWDMGDSHQVLAASDLLCALEQVTSPFGPQFCHLLSEGIG